MKICPICQTSYADDDLNFCLDDGAVLAKMNAENPPETLLINHPNVTDPIRGFTAQTPVPGNWADPQPHPVQPQKSSKTWLLVLGVLGLAVLLCGGGFVGFVAWLGTGQTSNANGGVNLNNRRAAVENTAPNDRTVSQPIDLSGWVMSDNDLGITEYNNGEFLMRSKKKGFYYVLVATERFKTGSAATRVAVKNVDQAASNLGFGLIVNSDPVPLRQDYAFLIDSAGKRYRVVRHEPKKETTVVGWTAAPSIRDVAQENVLEVRDDQGRMNFYINGDLVTSVINTDGDKNGVPGLYAGDALQIAFTDFEIRK